MDRHASSTERPLRVGVTINIRDGNQSLWENGLFQNCLLLVQLFQRIPEVTEAVLVHGPGVTQIPEGLMLSESGVDIIGLEKAMETLDVVVEMSDQLAEDWVERFRAKGGRYVAMKVGNEYFIDVERPIYGLPHAGLCSSKVYDAVWTLPQYQDCCGDYFSMNMRAPVRILPHLWSPIFLEKSLHKLPEGIHFGYQPGRGRWRVCTFEPNLSMVKTSIIPMLVCEEAYRANPRFAQVFRFCNTHKAKDNPAFVRFARSLDIVKNGLSSFDGRFYYYEFMAKEGDCVVSHQWHNAQNYLYYETLYGGYPLIHNSPLIKDLGYYYPDFDCKAGGQVLLKAYERHDANLDLYMEKAGAFLRTLDISYPPNLEAYGSELKRLFESSDTGSAQVQKKNYSPDLITENPEHPPEISLPPTVDQSSRVNLHSSPIRGIDQVWVINLDRRPDRLESFRKHHPELVGGLNRLSAYDGKNLKLTPALARLFAPNNFQWHKPTIGCALSHLSLWYRLAHEEDNSASFLIFEDDARMAAGWIPVIEQALGSDNNMPTDWEILYLGGVLPQYRDSFEQHVSPINAKIARIRKDCVFGTNPPGYFHFCAYAYVLNKKGAQRILDLLESWNGYWLQADFVAAYTTPELDPKRPIYFFHPLLAQSFQDCGEGFARPYSEDQESTAKIDSDIWKNEDRFTPQEISDNSSEILPLNIPAALGLGSL